MRRMRRSAASNGDAKKLCAGAQGVSVTFFLDKFLSI
jgi:hypothetical protein